MQAETRPLKQKLHALTTLRFVAAMMIVVGHAHQRFGSLGIATHFALNQGVSFFFVLSGFVLYINYPNIDGRASTWRFFIARFARIWPAHIVALILFFIVLPKNLQYIPWPKPDLMTLLIPNILLVQAWIPSKDFFLSLNAVSWSISVEFFFYLSFPILIIYKDKWKIHLILIISLMLMFFYYVNDNNLSEDLNSSALSANGLLYVNPLVRIFEFLTGILTARLYLRHRHAYLNPWKATLAEACTLTLAAVSLHFLPLFSTSNFCQSLFGSGFAFWLRNEGAVFCFAALVYVFARGEGFLSKAISGAPFTFLGEVSFAVYLVHQIILRAWDVRFSMFASFPLFLQYLLFLTTVLLCAICVHLGVERPARLVIVNLSRRTSANRLPAAQPQER